MIELTAAVLKIWIAEEKPFLLIDVREEYEHAGYNIGGILMPLGEVMSRAGEVSRSQPVVFYCEKGIRSVIAIQRLEGLGFEHLYNLAGGMKAWRLVSG